MAANDIVLRISAPTRDGDQLRGRAWMLKRALEREGIRWTVEVDGEHWGEDHTDPDPEEMDAGYGMTPESVDGDPYDRPWRGDAPWSP